jgi:hypothetical protein
LKRDEVFVHFEGFYFKGAFVLEALVYLILLLGGGCDFFLTIVPLFIFVNGFGDVVLRMVLFVA